MNGIFPFSRGSLTLDLMALVMALTMPLLSVSIFFVKYRNIYKIHKHLQTLLGLTLGLTIICFELDMRLNGWRQFAVASPYYKSFVFPALWLHLSIAIPTLFIWTYTIGIALRHKSPGTVAFKDRHKFFGWLSAYAMLGTALSGWLFFWLAFIA